MRPLPLLAPVCLAVPLLAQASDTAWWDGFASANAPDRAALGLCEYAGELIVVGQFDAVAGDPQLQKVARWSGAAWLSTGAVFDDVNAQIEGAVQWQGQLVIGGSFNQVGAIVGTRHLAAWDGAVWSGLQGGYGGDYVAAVGTWGADLIVAGVPPGTGTRGELLRWNGTQWTTLLTAQQVNGQVRTLAEYGGQLVIGGDFTQIQGTNMRHIARFDGVNWLPLGTGTEFPAGSVESIFDIHVEGTDLIAVGGFTDVAGVAMNNVARWDGGAWSALGSGLGGRVFSIAAHQGGLVVCGDFETAGGTPASRIALWTAGAWAPLGSGLGGSGRALRAFGGDLYAGGLFTLAGNKPSFRIARHLAGPIDCNGNGIDDATDIANATSQDCNANQVPDECEPDCNGNGIADACDIAGNPALDCDANGIPDDCEGGAIVRCGQPGDELWWQGFAHPDSGGMGLDGFAYAMVEFDGDLIVAGDFLRAGPVAARGVARWSEATGTPTWTALNWPEQLPVRGLVVYQGELVAGDGQCGLFRWDADAWVPMALTSCEIPTVAAGGVLWFKQHNAYEMFGFSGGQLVASWLTRDGSNGGRVWRMRSIDDHVLALGRFTRMAYACGIGIPCTTCDTPGSVGYMAPCASLGSGLEWQAGIPGEGFDAAKWGSSIVVGGMFALAGGNPASALAAWNGSTWTEVGGGVRAAGQPGLVQTVAADAENLFVAGEFDQVGAVVANKIARWDGTAWSPLGSGIESITFGLPGRLIQEMLVHRGRLFVAGGLRKTGQYPVASIGRYDLLPQPTAVESAAGVRPPPQLAVRSAGPNPFNPRTSLHIELARAANLEIHVHDAQGREVATLVAGWRQPGAHEVTWDGTDHRGHRVASGMYVATVRAGTESRSLKLVLLK